MPILLYRHAESIISGDEKIAGDEFIAWVQKYNASGIKIFKHLGEKEKTIYASTLPRSYETARILGDEVIQDPIFQEAGIPFFSFPPMYLPAKLWLALARLLWFCGAKRQCESFAEAKNRAETIADRLTEKLQRSEKLVVIGHGWINLFIQKEFRKRNWLISQDKHSSWHLGKIIMHHPGEPSGVVTPACR